MRHTTESLAAEFLARANEFGWLRLTKKQGDWLYSLAACEDYHPTRRGSLVVVHGDGWKLVREQNGSWIIGGE